MFKFKKIASMALAAAMVFALAVPAFANSTITYSDKNAQNVTMKGATTTPKVQISLPSGAALTNSFLLNPYKVGYKLTLAGAEKEATAAAALEGKQVISPILAIANATLCKMKVDVTVSTTVAGNLKLLTADYESADARKADTKNNAFMYVNMKYDQAAAPGDNTSDFNTAVVTALNETNKQVESIILKAGDVKKTAHIIQSAATAADTPNYIWIQFGGSMAEGPTTPWTDKDTATVAFAFTFTPDQNAAYPTTTSATTPATGD